MLPFSSMLKLGMRAIVIVFALISLLSCNDSGDKAYRIGELRLDPYGNAPMAAVVTLSADRFLSVELSIEAEGRDSWSTQFDVPAEQNWELPVIGLFAGRENHVTLRFFAEETSVGEEHFTVQTEALPEDFPEITATGEHNAQEMTFVLWYRTPAARLETVGLLVDSKGEARWYSSFAQANLAPMEIIDGLIYTSDAKSKVFVYDLLGKERQSVDIAEHGFTGIHHDIVKKPNGNLILPVDEQDGAYTEDFLIEVNPDKSSLEGLWDLKDVLPDVADVLAGTPMTQTGGDTANENPLQRSDDPIHNNAVFYDPNDDALLVTSQRIGVAKLYRSGGLHWLLAPQLINFIDDVDHNGQSDSLEAGYTADDPSTWTGDFLTDNEKSAAYSQLRYPINGKPAQNYSGFEFAYQEFLLQPLDEKSDAISSESELLGLKDHADFAYPFRPHAAMVLENGHLFLFDNGLNRNFGAPMSSGSYSRAVEYEVTPDSSDGFGGTVKQVWQYRLSVEADWYGFSPIVSDVDELANGHRLIVFGALGSSILLGQWADAYGSGPKGALITEIDPSTDEELHTLSFERTILDNYPNTELSIYRAERMDPYQAWR
ncbi:MAG: aryl-sulfate sulfotransferase [Myxococcales bacterium]|nr:MAG: aryl-sulfate sulfotransferase [Myxococcales bacterium]